MTVQDASVQPLRIVIVGHVDHGKSTLVGRLIHDTGSLPEGKFEAITAMCQRRGMPFEWAFLMDALKSERDQGITIDTAQIWFSTRQAQIRADRRAGPQGISEEHGLRRCQRRCRALGHRCSRRCPRAVASARLSLAFARRRSGGGRHQQDGPGSIFEAALRGSGARDPRLSRRNRRHPDERHSDFGTRGRSDRQPLVEHAVVPRAVGGRGPRPIRAAGAAHRFAAALAGPGRLQIRRAAHYRRTHRERAAQTRRHASVLAVQ